MINKTKSLNGLATINIELTSRCNKNCWICGRRKRDQEFPELVKNYGDMEFSLLDRVAKQLPPNIVVQLHNNGEPTLYPRLGDAIRLFDKQITGFDTNGILIVEKANEIIGNLDTMAISVIEDDPLAEEQLKNIVKFIDLKKDRKPHIILRLNGDVDSTKYEKLGLVIARRLLHSPMGSFNYKKQDPTVPEIGICLDFLHHMAINKNGKVSICVRFDPKCLGVIGDANTELLANIWNSEKRMEWMEFHKKGLRKEIPLF